MQLKFYCIPNCDIHVHTYTLAQKWTTALKIITSLHLAITLEKIFLYNIALILCCSLINRYSYSATLPYTYG